jgi:hypothetical protein
MFDAAAAALAVLRCFMQEPEGSGALHSLTSQLTHTW